MYDNLNVDVVFFFCCHKQLHFGGPKNFDILVESKGEKHPVLFLFVGVVRYCSMLLRPLIVKASLSESRYKI
jgi:hypothetical protein